MIYYVSGKLAAVEEDRAVIDVNGIGFSVFMPLRDLRELGPSGSFVTAYTYLNVREDAMQLYGFLSKDDLSVFRLLINISGIGPKVAVGVLSQLTADDLRFAVLSDDIKTIQSAPGIGKKTAQKLILELKDKLKLEDAIEHSFAGAGTSSGDNVNRSEAIEALEALGYSGSEALKAVNRIENIAELSVEEIIKQALKEMF